MEPLGNEFRASRQADSELRAFGIERSVVPRWV